MPNHLKIDGKGGQFPCFWLDNSGGKPWSDLDNYGFTPTRTAQSFSKDTTSGSYALSDKFHVKQGEQVNVAAILATAHTQPYWDFGFAILVQGTTVAEVLFAMRPDGINQIGDTGPNVLLAAPSDGVTFSQAYKEADGTPKDATGIVLNGVDYGSIANAGCGNLSTYLSSKCKPSPGEYQILFGMFVTDNRVNPARPAAMVVPFFNVTQG